MCVGGPQDCEDCAVAATAAGPGHTCIDSQLVPCPSGSVCTADAQSSMVSMRACTRGQLCLYGFSEPQTCPMLSACEGDQLTPTRAAYALFVVLIMAVQTIHAHLEHTRAM
jgi:hypothetical protein